jgi:rhamnose transport system permease protein
MNIQQKNAAVKTKARRFFASHQWELILLSILVCELIFFKIFLPNLLNPFTLMEITINFMEVGIIAIPMAYIIISKNIDISVGSMIALDSIVLALCFQLGLPQMVSILITLICGAFAGFVNGVITTKMKIPSLVVTLGTFSLYRGIAYVVLGDETFHAYPDSFLIIGRGNIFKMIPISLVVFIFLCVIFGILLHHSTFGRKVYAIGNNQKASRFSGVLVDKTIIILFVLIGMITAIASVILTSRNASTRGNMALGIELDTITAVVLGGVNISGGKGNLLGVVLSIFIIGLLRNGMYAQNISPEIMKIVIGGLLISSLLIPKLFEIRQRTGK